MKRVLLIISVVVISLFPFHASAQEKVTFDQSIVNKTDQYGRVQKVIIIPAKRTKSAYIPDEKFAQEIAYYFPRNGIEGNTINYILLSDGKSFEIDSNFQLNLSKTNLDNRAVGILWIYEDKFDLNNSQKQYDELIKLLNDKIIPNSDLSDNKDIQERHFSFSADSDNKVSLSFGSQNEDIQKLQEKIGTSLDYTKKTTGDFTVSKISKNENLPPNEVVSIDVVITSKSDEDIFIGKSNALTIRSVSEASDYFVSDSWINTRTLLYDDNTFISAKSSRTYHVKFKTPIMPGEYKDAYTFYAGEKKIQDLEIKLTIADTGQKVLRVSPTGFGYLTVRSEPSLNSPEIGRAAPGVDYIFTDFKDGFYKIVFADKEGWVYSRYVKVIKAQ